MYQITAAYRTPDYEAYRPQIPILSVLSPQTNFVEAPPEKKIPGYATGGYMKQKRLVFKR
jgi:hypothetical protein